MPCTCSALCIGSKVSPSRPFCGSPRTGAQYRLILWVRSVDSPAYTLPLSHLYELCVCFALRTLLPFPLSYCHPVRKGGGRVRKTTRAIFRPLSLSFGIWFCAFSLFLTPYSRFCPCHGIGDLTDTNTTSFFALGTTRWYLTACRCRGQLR